MMEAKKATESTPLTVESKQKDESKTLIITDTTDNKAVLCDEYEGVGNVDVDLLTLRELGNNDVIEPLLQQYKLIYIVANRDRAGDYFYREAYKSLHKNKKVQYFKWDNRLPSTCKNLKELAIYLPSMRYTLGIGFYINENTGDEPDIGNSTKTLSREEYIKELISEEPFTMNSLSKADLPATKWLVKDIIPEGLGIIAGAPKAGKSMLLLQLCYCLGNGYDEFLGYEIPNKANIVYYDFESNSNLIKNRISNMFPNEEPPKNVYIHQEPLTYEEGFLELMKGHIKKYDADLVVVDMYTQVARTTGADSESYIPKARELVKYKDLAELYGITIILVMHTRKSDKPRKIAVEDIMGSQAYTGTTQFNIVIGKTLDCKGNEHVINFVETNRAGAELDLVLRLDPETLTFMNEGSDDEIKQKKARDKFMNDPIVKAIKNITTTVKRTKEALMSISATDVLESIPDDERYTSKGEELNAHRIGRFITSNKKDFERYIGIAYLKSETIKDDEGKSKRVHKWKVK